MNKYIKLLKDEVIREEIITMYDIFYTGLEFGSEDIKYVLCLDDEAYVIPYIDNKPVVNEGIELTIISKDNSTPIEQIIEDKIKELNV
jgi:hypothetical protein